MSQRNLVLVLLMLLGTQSFTPAINAGAWSFCCGSRQRPARVRTWAHEHQNDIARTAAVLAVAYTASALVRSTNQAIAEQTPLAPVSIRKIIIQPALGIGTAVKLVLAVDERMCKDARHRASFE